MRVDVGTDSNSQGELLPTPWSASGKMSELYLLKGGKFTEYDSKKPESEMVKTLKDTAELGTYVQNLTETDQELKRLHVSHVPTESKSITFDSI